MKTNEWECGWIFEGKNATGISCKSSDRTVDLLRDGSIMIENTGGEGKEIRLHGGRKELEVY